MKILAIYPQQLSSSPCVVSLFHIPSMYQVLGEVGDVRPKNLISVEKTTLIDWKLHLMKLGNYFVCTNNISVTFLLPM